MCSELGTKRVWWIVNWFFVAEYIWVQEVLVKEGDFWVRLINFVVENG